MRRSVMLALVILISGLFGQPTALAQQRTHLVVVSIDGMMPASYTTDGPAEIPTIRQLAEEGVFADGAIGVVPTVTYPSHTTLITGVPPAIHGVYGNRILDPEGRSNAAWYWYTSAIRVPTLASAARARGLTTAAVSWPVSVGMKADFLVPEYKITRHPESLNLLRELSTPNLLRAIELGLGRPFATPLGDRDRTEMMKFILKTHQPQVALLHLFDLDGASHNFGPESPEAQAALEQTDGYLAEILETLDEAGMRDRTYVAVVSDHGFLPLEHRLQPNALFRNEGLLHTNDRDAIVEWQAYFHSSGGSGFVFLDDPNDAALRERVHGLLQRLHADPANGINAVWTADDLARMGAQPDAAFGIDMREGFYTGGRHDTLLRPEPSKGGHGFAPDRPGLEASFVLAGPDLGRRGSLGTIRLTQVAPTLAHLMNLVLSAEADDPVEGLKGLNR